MIYLPKVPAHPDPRLGLSYCCPLYTVTVNGQPCDVHSCRVSAVPFNQVWPGYQRSVNQTEEAGWIRIYGDEAVTVTVKCLLPIQKAVLRPLSKQVQPVQQGDTLTFTLTQNGSYVLEPNGEHNALHIFFDTPQTWPEKENATFYFGPGVHFPTLLTLHSGDSVYLDPEAIVFTAVYARDAENVHIFGGGVLDDSGEERLDEACYEGHSKGNLRMYNMRKLRIEGVVLQNSANWVLALYDSEDVVIDGIKIVGQWRYNTDGIDLTNTSRVLLQNCFVRSFDDTIVVKAIYNHTACRDIRVEHCVLWCGWGKTLELGLETSAIEYCNISFIDCDLIHNDTGALAISNGNYADIHDILYRDIRVEYNADSMTNKLQASPEDIYEGQPGHMAHLLRIRNSKFAQGYDYITIADERDANYGQCHAITYRNIQVQLDEGLPMPTVHFISESDTAPITDITVDGLFVNGKRITAMDQLNCEMQNVGTVDWK